MAGDDKDCEVDEEDEKDEEDEEDEDEYAEENDIQSILREQYKRPLIH